MELVLHLRRPNVGSWTLAQSGFNLIIDGALPYGHPELRADCLRILERFAPRLVGVTCATHTLTAREQARHVAQPGWAAHQAHDVNDGLTLDATVDTSTADPAHCARSVLDQLLKQ
jgi:chloramphenicol 3-O phosphotransferase